MSESLILDSLKRIEDKVDANTAATSSNTLGIAVLGERLQNTMGKVDAHLESDTKMHERLEKLANEAKSKAEKVERSHNTLATRITTIAAAIAFAFTTILEFAKDAVAGLFNAGH